MTAARALALGVKRLRKRLGMTQANLAESAELHVQFVSQIERGDRAASIETIDRLAKALDVSAAELLAEGESAKPRAAVASERVQALLAAWKPRDQERLINLLVELRRLAARAKQR